MNPPRPDAPLLEVRDLRTWFHLRSGTVRAVDGVSLEVAGGEAVALVGESGCGKSVTALSITGLVPAPGRIMPDSSIRLQGRELVGASPRALRSVRGRRVGMVFQQPSTALNPVMPVGPQIAEVLRHHLGMSRKEARERAVALLEEVGIHDPSVRFHAFPHELSGGMRQRVMIAAALAGEPDLLIADEPTTALDVTVQARILELLSSLRERRGMALLLVTHDLGVVAEVCDRVLVMYAGRVAERGPVDGILHTPLHPYTRGLLESLPRPGSGGRLRPIPGQVPAADRWPPGCRFRERCPRAWDRCAEEPPLLVPGGERTDGARDPARFVGAPLAAAPASREKAPDSREGAPPFEGGRRRGQKAGREARCWLVEEPGGARREREPGDAAGGKG